MSTRASPEPAADREGFQHLVAEVSLGKAGIVLGLECSRLARNNADWHRLLQICAFNYTLILDEDGLYDPCNFNDRLLLGLKGTMSEAELYLIRARLRGGILAKARRGELALPLPAGLVYDAAGRSRSTPTPGCAVPSALFGTFAATGSARAVVKAFHAENLSFPMPHQGGPHAGELYWTALTHARVLNSAAQPPLCRRLLLRPVPPLPRRRRPLPHHRQAPRQWIALIPDAHPGYISFGPVRGQPRSAGRQRRRPRRGPQGRARPRGPRPAAGLAVCGKCGRRMTVRYHTRADGTAVPGYVCQAAGITHGIPICQAIPGASSTPRSPA